MIVKMRTYDFLWSKFFCLFPCRMECETPFLRREFFSAISSIMNWVSVTKLFSLWIWQPVLFYFFLRFVFIQAHQVVPQMQMLVELITAATEVHDEESATNSLRFLNNRSTPKAGWLLLIKYCGHSWISHNVLLPSASAFVASMVSNLPSLFTKRYGDSSIFKAEIIKSMPHDN